MWLLWLCGCDSRVTTYIPPCDPVLPSAGQKRKEIQLASPQPRCDRHLHGCHDLFTQTGVQIAAGDSNENQDVTFLRGSLIFEPLPSCWNFGSVNCG
jgi:hypothetical protein